MTAVQPSKQLRLPLYDRRPDLGWFGRLLGRRPPRPTQVLTTGRVVDHSVDDRAGVKWFDIDGLYAVASSSDLVLRSNLAFELAIAFDSIDVFDLAGRRVSARPVEVRDGAAGWSRTAGQPRPPARVRSRCRAVGRSMSWRSRGVRPLGLEPRTCGLRVPTGLSGVAGSVRFAGFRPGRSPASPVESSLSRGVWHSVRHSLRPGCIVGSGKPRGERGQVNRQSDVDSDSFGGYRLPPEATLLAVSWYVSSGLSNRDVDELLR